MVTNARPLHSAPFAIPLADLLRELAGVVGQLTAAQYNAPAGESFFPAEHAGLHRRGGVDPRRPHPSCSPRGYPVFSPSR